MTFAEALATRPSGLRRTLAILATIAFVAAVWNFLVVPVTWMAGSQTEWRAEVRSELARAKGRAAAQPELQSRLSALPAAPIWRRFYEPAEGGDARALIQRDISNLCAASGALVQSVVPLPASEERGLTRHGVRIAATVTADQLKALVSAIRSHPHYLRVEYLTVQAPQVQPPDQNPPLVLSMEVFGYSPPATIRGKT